MKRPLSDADLDRLLAAPRRGTTPEFERRLAALADDVARGPAQPRTASRVRRWLPWTLPLAAAAAVVLWLEIPHASAPPPDFERLLELDAELAGAAPLLDASNRDLCLELSANPEAFRS
ncbi:MAG: hypothetical protein HYV96_07670 [Opitutae bacterium]|nr:hypothetical protein [Opitutae bacterium]